MVYNGSDKHKRELFEKKQDKLTEGNNITLTPLPDGTVKISASGGGSGTVTDVLVDGQSVVNQNGEALISMPSDFEGATFQQDGSAGLVPAPAVADRDKFLKGDGTWRKASTVDDLNDLSDVNLSHPSEGQTLIYNGARWENGSILIKIKDVVQNAQSMADENGIVDLSILTVIGDEINTILRYLGIEFYTDENGDEYTDENGLKYSSV